MNFRKRVIILTLAGAALVPHVLYLFQPYFADESAVLLNGTRFLYAKTLIPFHVSYPTFFSYLATPFIAVAGHLAALTGNTTGTSASLVELYVLHPLALALPARVPSLLLLVAASVATYRMISARKGVAAGTAVSLMVLLSPSLLEYGSYALPDVAVLAFSILSFAQLLTFEERYPGTGSTKNLMWSAAYAGLAIACKYNAAATLIPIFTLIVMLKLRHRLAFAQASRLFDIAALCCVIAFLAGSPSWILAPRHLAGGLTYELKHAADGHLGSSGIPLLGQLELLATHAPLILLAGIAGIGVWWRDRTTGGRLALATVLGSLALTALSSKQSIHYLYPGYVGWLYFAGTLVAASMNAAPRWTLAGLLAIALPLFGFSMAKSTAYLAPNTTQLTEDWIYRNIPAGERIATDFLYVPALYSNAGVSQLRKLFDVHAEPVIEEIARTKVLYDLVELRQEVSWLADTEAKYIVTSDQVFRRYFCTGIFTRRPPAAGTPLRAEFDRREKFYATLFQPGPWQVVRVFETGNGPPTYVLGRKQHSVSTRTESMNTGKDEIDVRPSGLLPQCGFGTYSRR